MTWKLSVRNASGDSQWGREISLRQVGVMWPRICCGNLSIITTFIFTFRVKQASNVQKNEHQVSLNSQFSDYIERLVYFYSSLSSTLWASTQYSGHLDSVEVMSLTVHHVLNCRSATILMWCISDTKIDIPARSSIHAAVHRRAAVLTWRNLSGASAAVCLSNLSSTSLAPVGYSEYSTSRHNHYIR